jgi:hypothetical protein
MKKYEWISAGSGPTPSATVKALWTGKEFVQASLLLLYYSRG